MAQLKIVGVGGSLNEKSTSRAILNLALEGAKAAGAITRLLDVSELSLPMYHHGAGVPAEAQAFADAVAEADGMIWSSPLYHGSMSGLMKNALDWLELLDHREPKYLGGRPVGLIATAGGGQALQAINAMEQVVRALRGFTVPFVIPVNHSWKLLDDSGKFTDEKIAGQLRKLGEEVRRSALLLRAPT